MGRDEAALQAAALRLKEGAPIEVSTLAGLNAVDVDSHEALISSALERLPQADTIILAVGVLGERGGLPTNIQAALQVLQVNVVGAGSLMMHSAKALRDRPTQGESPTPRDSRRGTLVVLSSLAAERPRRANAVYAASKAALDGLGQGLADDLRAQGVRVLLVRPGFVKTRMTKDLPVPPLACSPRAVALATVRGIEGGAQTVWAPPRLRWVGLAMRLMPRPLFRKLSL